jgi:heme a synthase
LVKSPLLSRIALAACLFAFFVIGLGAFTRLVDAGLGCPDWPGCYGQLTVPVTGDFNKYKAWAEMTHRYFVGCLSMLILGVVFFSFTKKYRSRGNIILALSLVLLLIYQISLGRWTVTLKLLPIIVTQHLLGGFLILSILWLVYLNNKISTESRTFARGGNAFNTILILAFFGLLFLLLQIFLGAWVSTNYASLSCSGFPFCMNQGTVTPQIKEAFNVFSPLGVNYEGGVLSQSVRQTIHMFHRAGALILTLYLLFFTAIAMQKLLKMPELLRLLFVILGLLSVQISLGIINVFFKLPVLSAVSHTLVAVLLLLTLITFIFKLVRVGAA